MCLYIKKYSRIRVANKDIKCLKFVYTDYNGELTTPFQRVKVELGKTYHSDIVIKKGRWDDSERLINIGLHSLMKVEDCHSVTRRISAYNYKIINCIIPKGSKYITGMFDELWKSYVSDTIIYIDEVKEVKNSQVIY